MVQVLLIVIPRVVTDSTEEQHQILVRLTAKVHSSEQTQMNWYELVTIPSLFLPSPIGSVDKFLISEFNNNAFGCRQLYYIGCCLVTFDDVDCRVNSVLSILRVLVSLQYARLSNVY